MPKPKRDLTKLDGLLEEILETPSATRLNRIFHLVTGLAKANAEACYQGLLAEKCLMEHEADMLQMLGQRLEKPVAFRHAMLTTGDEPLLWKEGRYQDAN